MDDQELLAVLGAAADAIHAALRALENWGPAGTRPGQYHSDLVADQAAIEVLADAGLGVLSEESGSHHPERPITVVLDPVDGSTNASRGLPWFATSLCAVDEAGPLAALVVNQATGTRYGARRGGGATRDGVPIMPSACTSLDRAIVGVNGHIRRHLGWAQYRALGAAALDLCAVADGTLDAYVDNSPTGQASWDYLGAVLVLQEAGAVVTDLNGDDLGTLAHGARHAPIAAATRDLYDALRAARLSERPSL